MTRILCGCLKIVKYYVNVNSCSVIVNESESGNNPGSLAGMSEKRESYAALGGNSIENMKRYALLGSQIGAKYHILEGFAYGWPDDQIRELVAYSNQQGIRKKSSSCLFHAARQAAGVNPA